MDCPPIATRPRTPKWRPSVSPFHLTTPQVHLALRKRISAVGRAHPTSFRHHTTLQGESSLPTPAPLPLLLSPPATFTDPSLLPSSPFSLQPSSTTDTDPPRLSSIMKLYGRPLYPGGLGHCPLIATLSLSLDELVRDFDPGKLPELRFFPLVV